MKTKSIAFFLIITLGLFFYSRNTKAQEIQIPVCSRIQVITPQMASGIGFFADYPGFMEASVYQTQDSLLVMEILYKNEGSILKLRKPLSRDEIDTICAQINTKSYEEAINDVDVDRDGRRKIIASTMAYSLAYYAWAIPTAFNAGSGKAYTASYLLLGSAGFFVPMLATENGTFTKGMAKGYTYGCFLGAGHGLSLGALVSGGYDHSAILGVSTVVSISEGVVGLNYARKHQFDRAHMRTIGSMGTWGFAYGLGIPAMWENSDELAFAGSSIAVSGLGIYLGDHFARKLKPADGDVTVINSLGVLGGAISTTVIYSFAGDEGSSAAYVGGAILGSLTGITLGFNKTSKINYTRSEGNLIILGEIAGGLIGGGLSTLMEAKDVAGLWLVTAGLFGGFAISDGAIQQRKAKTNNLGMNFSFDINPVAFQNVLNKNSFEIKPGRPILNADLAKFTLHL
jgi:hypothetical protein